MQPTNAGRRNFLKTAGALSTASLLTNLAGCATAKRPTNVVLIMCDDLGWEGLSSYGSTVYNTPRLDELARTGARFNHCYSQPLCTPTRVQIMTGQYNFRNYIGFGVLKPGERTFGHVMQNAGYATLCVGKWQLWGANNARGFGGKGVWPQEAGFDEYCLWQIEERGERYANPLMYVNKPNPETIEDGYGPDVAANYLCDFMERKKDQPFFAYYPMILTHNPFVPTPDSPEWNGPDRSKRDNRFFKDEIEYTDKIVGRIVDKLEVLGLRENTLVMFVGDNGTNKVITSPTNIGPIKGDKGQPNDAGTRVPFVVNMPGTVKPGQVLDDLVDLTDFLPTIREATGAAPLDNMIQDGQSFLPQLRGEAGSPREAIFCYYNPDWGNFDQIRFARNQRWKLYDDGRLYDIPADVLEKNPIMSGGGPEAEAARKKLQPVLDRLQ
jgi:arylsulfatase A